MKKRFLLSLLVVAGYLLAAKYDSGFHILGGFEQVFWVPGGVSLVAVYLGGWQLSAVVFASAFLAHVIDGHSRPLSLIFAVAATLSIQAGVLGLRFLRINLRLSALTDVLRLLLVAILIIPMVSMSIEIAGHWIFGDLQSVDLAIFVPLTWSSKVIGVIGIAPLVFLMTLDRRVKFSAFLVIESLIFSFCLLLFVSYVFFHNSVFDSHLPLAYRRLCLLLPLGVWAALRFGPMGGAVMTSVLGVSSIVSISFGNAEISSENILQNLVAMQLFIGAMSASFLILCASVSQAKTSEAKFKSVFFDSGVSMAQISSDGRIIEVNQSYCELVGYSRANLLSRTFLELTHPDDRSDQSKQLSLVNLGSETSVYSEKRFVRADGEIIWASVDATLIHGGASGEAFSLVSLKDISNRKRAEAMAEELKSVAIAANSAKSIFIAGMSHEIRTPLGVILGFVEILKDESLDASRRMRFLETIHRNASELGRLIDDILDLSKVEAGQLEVTLEPVHLSRLIEDIRQTFEVSLRRKGLHFEVRSLGMVPDVVETDGRRMRQILINIVGNAIKFTSSGSVIIELSMLSKPDISKTTQLSIAVKDSGCGIAESERSKLFIAFSQASTTTTKNFGGTGLGLILSKRLATLLGGDVVLTESSVSEGSVFTITIDSGSGAKTIAGQTQQIPPPRHGVKSLTGFRILVVEDTPDQAMLIQLLLSEQGAIVDVAANGAQAIEKIRGGRFDAVLMDMQMPVMDGFAATRKLRALGFRKPIIAVTAQAMREDQEKCLEAGCTSHFAKPFTQGSLTGLLIRALKGNGSNS